MNMEIVRSRSGFRNKVPGGFIEVHGFRISKKFPYTGGHGKLFMHPETVERIF